MTSYSIDTKEIRKFGFVAFVFFGCLCGLGLWLKRPLPIYIFGCLSLVGVGFVVMPSTLRPIYASWVKVARFLGTIITTLMLTLAYYLVIMPTALIKRIFGGTPLPLKPDKEVSSYWVARTEPAQPKERFIKRY